jgi:hypothetical protein
MGRHSKPPPDRRRTAQRRAIATVELVDVNLVAHRVTVDDAALGLPLGRYTTVCGGDVLPAAMVARAARFCRLCTPIPSQRTR